ncbi:MAG: DUF3501 family protein [Lysobacterales bacterium]
MSLQLTVTDLDKLEDYAELRAGFREEVLAEKSRRRVDVGPNLTLYFENRLTVRYQVQEMLRIERIFERDGIQEELDAYNPLIPDGGNLKATAMIEYPDEQERRAKLRALKGIEDLIWVRVGQGDRVFAIADEDLERSNDDKTSAVHFLRFEVPQADRDALNAGEPLFMGVSHTVYDHETQVADATRESLRADFS